jgi:predicted transcriptional regulator
MAISVKIDEGLKNRVQSLAVIQRRSAHWVMREAIQQYVEREEARESFRQEAIQSWTEYQQTGRHLTGEEVRGWLAQWGSEQDGDAPSCHE